MENIALPAGKAARKPRGWMFRVAVHSLAWLIVVLVLYGIVPRFEAIFTDFGIAMPAMTVVAVTASHLVTRYAALVVLAFGLLAVVDGHILLHWTANPRRRALASFWSRAASIIPFATIVYLLVAIVLPLLTLLTKLSG
jgi:type II secretory pathway component PulF